MTRPTIADIAQRSGVSKGAVSFALNGRPGVSEETRRRILAVADEMNWRPHRAARSLGKSRAGAVGLILSRPALTLGVEPFFGQVVSGLQAGLAEDGTALQLLVVGDTESEMDAYRTWSAEQRVDGFVLLDPLAEDPRIPELERLGVPVMVMGGPLENTSLSFTWADDREAMHEAVDYLAALGHRRVVHVAGMPQFLHTQRRMKVLAEAKARHELAEVTSIPTDYSDSEGAVITRRVLSRRERPTAIVYDSDVMAVAGLGVALEMGVRVPQDLSILSFDDSLLARLTHPALTALTRDTQGWAAEAARELIRLIADPTLTLRHKSSTPVLVPRESTHPPADR
ncbi:LacI family DNA-binding transcriptional regulator [Nocardioides albertanoniae]|nr:LacI family DNA-binding transcriptional regulator [Nocardioides albertanoniae]